MGSASVLILLDLLAAFNTIDWNILLDLLRRLGVRVTGFPSFKVSSCHCWWRKRGPALDLHIAECLRTRLSPHSCLIFTCSWVTSFIGTRLSTTSMLIIFSCTCFTLCCPNEAAKALSHSLEIVGSGSGRVGSSWILARPSGHEF